MAGLKQREGDQPLPKPNGRRGIQSLVIDDITARRDVGISRYGTPLQPFNGRSALRDAYEEAMDLTVYLRQVLEEHNIIPAVHRLLNAQEALLRRWANVDQDARRELWQGLHAAADAVRDAMHGKDREPPATPEQEAAWEEEGVRIADAYELGVKAEALREFAAQLDAGTALMPTPPSVIAELARERAAELEHRVEELTGGGDGAAR